LGSRPGSAASGFLSGFFSVTAGTGGPPLTVYATSTQWVPATFSASVQVILLVNGSLALLVKGLPADLPLLGWCATAVIAGVALGSRLASRISPAAALNLVLALAAAGSIAAAARGVIGALA
jgi:uncharacterized membrane protein YfcA